MSDSIFSSKEQFSSAFIDGLDEMLRQHQGLGVFILVCANAGFDARIHKILADSLRQRFEQTSEHYRAALRTGRSLNDADDDVLVFLKLMAIGFDALLPTQRRQAGPWEIQFNQLRAFRPPRMANTRVETLHVPFNHSGFHFNKPFLRKEAFWQGELQGREIELLYNKFPFADYHGLLVPQREHEAPQFLTHDDHHYMWRVTKTLGKTLPGVGFAYNAYGAYSSVNHLHFQMFVRDEPLPVQLPQWRHNGGEENYPSRVERFDDPEAAWRYVETIHRGGDSYNLLYLPGEIYCLPRRIQGSYQHAPWTAGFAWYEMCGGMVSFSLEDYERLDESMIEGEFESLAL